MSSVSLKQRFSARNNPPHPTQGTSGCHYWGMNCVLRCVLLAFSEQRAGKPLKLYCAAQPPQPVLYQAPNVTHAQADKACLRTSQLSLFLPVDPFTLWLTSTVLPCMFKLFHIPTFCGLGFNHLCFGFSLNTGCISALSFSESRTLF